jgi:hypothetical protein
MGCKSKTEKSSNPGCGSQTKEKDKAAKKSSCCH